MEVSNLSRKRCNRCVDYAPTTRGTFKDGDRPRSRDGAGQISYNSI